MPFELKLPLFDHWNEWQPAAKYCFVALVAIAVMLAVWANGDAITRAEQRQSGKAAAEPQQDVSWTLSPVESEHFTALERIRVVTLGPTLGFNDVHEIKLSHRDGRDVGTFTVIGLYSDSFWLPGKYDDLYITQRAKAPIIEHLRDPRFRALISYAEEVLCVGLVSSTSKEGAEADQLSHKRAERLRALLATAGGFDKLQLHAVPFGRAQTPVTTRSADQWQRSGVLIGLKRTDRTVADHVLYAELLKRVRLKHVNLNDYSRVGQLREPAKLP